MVHIKFAVDIKFNTRYYLLEANSGKNFLYVTKNLNDWGLGYFNDCVFQAKQFQIGPIFIGNSVAEESK